MAGDLPSLSLSLSQAKHVFPKTLIKMNTLMNTLSKTDQKFFKKNLSNMLKFLFFFGKNIRDDKIMYI